MTNALIHYIMNQVNLTDSSNDEFSGVTLKDFKKKATKNDTFKLDYIKWVQRTGNMDLNKNKDDVLRYVLENPPARDNPTTTDILEYLVQTVLQPLMELFEDIPNGKVAYSYDLFTYLMKYIKDNADGKGGKASRSKLANMIVEKARMRAVFDYNVGTDEFERFSWTVLNTWYSNIEDVSDLNPSLHEIYTAMSAVPSSGNDFSNVPDDLRSKVYL